MVVGDYWVVWEGINYYNIGFFLYIIYGKVWIKWCVLVIVNCDIWFFGVISCWYLLVGLLMNGCWIDKVLVVSVD